MPKKKEEFDELICGKYVCAKKGNSININQKKVKTIFHSKITAWKSGGAYISAIGKYENHQVYVVVMEDLANE